MACEDQISTEDLENGKTDITTISEVALSREGGVSAGALIDSTQNRLGETISTLRGQLAKLGYEPPVVYAGSIVFGVNDNTNTIDRDGIVYAPLPSELPFTTTGTWTADDENKFFVAQSDPNLILEALFKANYADVREIDVSTITNGQGLVVTNPGIAGGFVLRNSVAHGLTDNGGTVIVIGPDWYAERIYNGVLEPEWFGAIADAGITDNIVALNDMFALVEPVWLNGDYGFGSTLTIYPVVPIDGPGEFTFTGSGETAIVLGSTAESSSVKAPVKISLKRSTTDLTDVNIGLNVINVFSSSLYLDVRFFNRNLKLTGQDGPCAYNTIYLNRLQNSLDCLELDAAGTSGYVNQNTFIGGRFGVSASSANDVRGVIFTNDSGAEINGNTLLNPSFELNNSGAGETVCFFGRSNTGEPATANDNKMVGGRFEATQYILGGIGILHNEFNFSRSGVSETIAQDIIQPGSGLELLLNEFELNQRTLFNHEPNRIAAFNRGHVVGNMPSASSYTTSPTFGAWFESDAFFNARPADAPTDVIKVTDQSRFIGVLLDLSDVGHDYHKRVDVKALLGGDGGRVAAVLWNSAGTKLTASTESNLTYYSSGGFYRQNADMTVEKAESTLAFSGSVAYVFVGIVAGSSSAEFKEVEFYVQGMSNIKLVRDKTIYASLGTATDLYIGHDDTPLSTLAPDANTGDQVGSFCRKADATSGLSDPIGWVYDGAAWIAGPVIP